MKRAAWVLVVGLLSRPAHAKSEETVAKGLATIAGTDIAAARDLAIKNALRQCIAQVAGEWIESHFEAETKEVATQKGHDFSQKIEDSVRSDVQGFVEKFRVLDEQRTKDGYEVRVSARVNTKKLTSLMEGLASAIEKAGRKPRVLMAVRERDTTDAAKPAPVSLAAGYVTQQLVGAGLDVLDGDGQWLEGNAKTAGQKRGADVVVWVDAEYKNLGVIAPGAEFEALVGQTRAEVRLTLRSLAVRGDRVLSAKPIVTTSIGTDYGRSLQRALQGNGNNVIHQACTDFFTQLKDALEAGGTLAQAGKTRFVIRKVGSYRAQAQPLVELLQGLDGVTGVNEEGFANAELRLAIDHSGERAGVEKALFKQCLKLKWCKSLDKLSADGDTLVFSY